MKNNKILPACPSCYAKDGKMPYQIYQKKQHIDAQGNSFSEDDLTYWKNVEVTKKEWLQ